MSYFTKGDKVFRQQDPNHPDCTPAQVRRSDHRLKRIESIEDSRAWNYWEEPRATYLRDLMSGSQTCLPVNEPSHTYVPLEDLIRILMADKDARIKELEDRLRRLKGGEGEKIRGKTPLDKPREDAGKVGTSQGPRLENLIEERDKTRAMLREAMNKLQNIDVIVNENKSLQGRLKCSEERVKILEEKKKNLEKELAELRSQSQIQVDLERAQKMLSDVNQKQEKAGLGETVLHNLSLERDELQEKVKMLEKELEESRKKEEEIEILKKKSESDSLDKEEIARENECYKRKLSSMKCLEKQIQELKREGRALADKYKKEAQKATDQLNRMAQAASELQGLRDERDALRRKVNELAPYEDQFNKLQKKLQRVDAVIAENEKLNAKLCELQNLEKENENLKRRLEELQEVEMNAAEDKERIMQLQCAVADQEEEMKDLLCQIERLTSGRIDEELDRLRCELSEKSSKLRLCEEQLAEIPMLEAEIDELRMKLQTCCKEFPDKKKSENRHQTLIVRLPSASKGIHVDYKTPEEKFRTRTGPCTGERMKKAISDCKELMSCDDVQNLLQKSKGIISSVLEDMNKHQKEMEELELRNKNMKEEIEMLKEIIADPDKSSLLKKIYDLKKDLDEKDKQIWRLLRNEEDVKAMKALNEKIKSELKDSELPQEEVDKAEEPKKAASEESRRLSELSEAECCKYLRKKTEDLKLQIKALNKLTEQLKEENKLLRELQKPCPDFSKELDEKCALENLLSLLQAELDAFKGQKLSDECEALRNELKRVLEQNCQLKALVHCYKERLDLEKKTTELGQVKLEAPEKGKAPSEKPSLAKFVEGLPQEARLRAPEDLIGKEEEERPEYKTPELREYATPERQEFLTSKDVARLPDKIKLEEPTEPLESKAKVPTYAKPKPTPSAELEDQEELQMTLGLPKAKETKPGQETQPEEEIKSKDKPEGAQKLTKPEDLAKAEKLEEPTEEEGPEEKPKPEDLAKAKKLEEPTEEEGPEEKPKPEDLAKAEKVGEPTEEEGPEEKPKPEDLAKAKKLEEPTEEERPEEKPKPEDLAKATKLGKPTEGEGPEEESKEDEFTRLSRLGAPQARRPGAEERPKPEDLAKAEKLGEPIGREKPEEKPKPEDLAKAEKLREPTEEEGPEEKPKPEDLAKAEKLREPTEEEGPEEKPKPEDLAKAEKLGEPTEGEGPEEKPKPEDLAKAEKLGKPTEGEGPEEKPKPEDLAKKLGEPTDKTKPEEKPTPEDLAKKLVEPTDKTKPEEKPTPEDLAKKLVEPTDKTKPEEKPTPEDLAKKLGEPTDEEGAEEKPKEDDFARASRFGAPPPRRPGAEEGPREDDFARASRFGAPPPKRPGPEEDQKEDDFARASRFGAPPPRRPGAEETSKEDDFARASRFGAPPPRRPGAEERPKEDDFARASRFGAPPPRRPEPGTEEKPDQQFGQRPGQQFGQRPGQQFGQRPGQRPGQQPGQRAGSQPGAAEPGKAMTPDEELRFLRGEVKRLQQENDNLKKQLDAARGKRPGGPGAPGRARDEEGSSEDASSELQKSRAMVADIEADNADKIKKLQSQHEKELAEREKTYNESLSALKSGYEGDIRKMADRHKSSVLRLQELHEDEVKDISSTHESQMGSVQSETQAALMDVAKGTAAKMKKLAEDHSRELKALKSELKKSQLELSELKKGKGRGVSRESEIIGARHLREMQKMRMTSRQKLSAMKEKMEEDRKRSSAEIELLRKQIKGQEGEGVCTCKFARRPGVKTRDPSQALDFNEVLEKILEEGLDALTFNEIVLVHRKACCALQNIVLRFKQGPPLLELEPAVDEPCPHSPLLDADKQQLLSRIFALETEITRKQKQTQEAILAMELAIKKERCRLMDVKNLLQNEQRKNSKLELLITSQTQFHTALRRERDELGSQVSFNQTLCEEKTRQLEEEMKSKRCLEIEVEKLKGKLKQLCMAMDIERGSFNSQQRDKTEMMRMRMEEAIQNERKLGLQLERETKCRLHLQRQLQSLRESLKHMVNLPETNNTIQNTAPEDKSDKERRNLDQINQTKSKIKATKPLKKHKK